MKYICNFSRKAYNNQSQNWCIIQDRRGIIYVANNGDLMEFDGVSWREIPVPNETVRSLAMDDKGTIYVGGINEIGYLVPDPKGSLKYVSLIHHLEEKHRNFAYVWRSLSTKEGIYFWTSKFLFLWDFKQLKVWEADSSFDASFVCRGKLYVRQRGFGLLEMRGNSLQLLPGAERFAAENVYMMARYDSQRLLLGTRERGLFIYNGKTAIPFPTTADDYLKKNQLYYGIRLSSLAGHFALATRQGGLLIIDSRGNLEHLYNKTCGLQDDSVKYVFEDFQGNLWLCLGEGISKIEYASPISVYDGRYDLPENVSSVVRHRGNLYAGTTRGLFFLEPLPSFQSPGKFRPVPGITGCCWSLVSTGDYLLAAADQGVFQVEKDRKRNITSQQSFVLYRSRRDPNRTWVGTRRGLVSLYFGLKRKHSLNNARWVMEHRFEHINQEIRTIVEDKKGDLWLGTRAKGVLRIDFPSEGAAADPHVTTYDSCHGLPTGEAHVFMAAGHVMSATRRGIFRFDEQEKVFIPDYTLGKEFAGGEDGRGVFRIVEDRDKNVWIHSRSRNIQAIPQPDGTFVINKKPFLSIPLAQVNCIYPDPYYHDNVIWFASVDGLVRYDTKIRKNYDLAFQTLIREVVVNGMPLIYDAEEFKYKESRGGYWKDNFPVFPYKDRNLRFEFAAPFFEGESEIMYQYFLKGYDNDWAAWTKDTRKDYTNLDPGLHTFRVRAMNVYGNLSSEAAFQFKVLPPWYKTWWAFVLYAIFAALMVFLLVKWRSWKLVREKQHLEQIILARTKEIKNKNLQLLEQSEKLAEMDRVKSRFFANISHEFRTPLTLITGPLEQMLTSPQEEEREQKKKMRLMLRNSRHLLSLINQLLDLSKFDSGKMKLQASQQNIVPFLKGIVESFDYLAVQNELHLEFHTESEDITLYFDGEKIEKAVCNLLINAIKFTPPGGKIGITLHVKKDIPPGLLEISVRDTGIGIPAAQLDHIFDRFYQAQGLKEHAHKGSGIGLALTKELVNLHHGEITVHSSEGKGSEFGIRLRLGDEHLKPEEIVHQPGVPAEPGSPKEDPDLYMLEKEEEEADQTTTVDLAQEKNIILVVEDSADVRTYIKGAIEPDYRVIEAKDGREGIKKALEIIPDLIISDIMMPGVDGYELCRVLKNDVKTSHVPIILLTAKAGEEDIIEGLETGADDYITKPFNTRILCARIKNLIDLRRQLQETFKREMTLQPAKMSVSGIDKEFLSDLQAVIDKNISDPEFNVDQLCKKLYMSHATLYRKMNALSGESPTEFIRSYRLKRGAELLESGVGTVLEVALEVGFSSANYFSKCFKKKFHQLPTEYQASGSS